MVKKPLILSKGRLYKPSETRMRGYPYGPADIARIREDFIKRRPSNLAFLLRKRYEWMSRFITDDQKGIEIGCGGGFSKLYVRSLNFILTDYFKNPWVEQVVDALATPFKDSSLDYIVISNTIHHLATPSLFFKECARVLKPGGLVIIQEINCSLFMRLMLTVMRHEGYSYDVDAFDATAVCNDPADPWSANCAIPNLLFDDPHEFEEHFPFRIIHHRYTECFIFPLSGGQNSKRQTVNLPFWLLRIVDLIDNFLIALAPKLFSLQRQIVLKKQK